MYLLEPSLSSTELFTDCLALWIPTNLSVEELHHEVYKATTVANATQDLLKNRILPDDFIQIIESIEINPDNYLNEISESLEYYFYL